MEGRNDSGPRPACSASPKTVRQTSALSLSKLRKKVIKVNLATTHPNVKGCHIRIRVSY